MIHEYIYVDIERVRSYFAQLSEGLPIEKISQKETEKEISGSVKGGMGIFGGKVEGDYRYLRADTETTSLHDHLVELFMEELSNQNLLHEFPRNDTQWDMEDFHDGKFVLVRGPIKILDYNFLVTRLKNLSEIEEQVRKISNFQGNKQEVTQNGNTNQAKNRSSRGRKTNRKNTANTFDENFIGALTAFVNQNFSDTMRTKVYPFPNVPDNHFVATAIKEFFRISTPTLINMYGPLIDANWSCLLQVNLGKKQDGIELSTEVPQQYDSLEAVFEFLEGHLTQFSSLFQQIKYPAVATTPIVIFREIQT